MAQRFERESVLRVPRDLAFAYHARPGALERLTPPWESARVLERVGTIADGGTVEVALGGGMRWKARHTDYDPPRLFRDEQAAGPFARWVHTHRFEEVDRQSTRLVDDIDYEVPLGWLGRMVAGGYVRRRLNRTFRYRHQVTAIDLERIHWAEGFGPKRIAVSGASGLIGTALSRFLGLGGHTVVPLLRRGSGGVQWDPERGTIDQAALEGFDAVVHLAGEPIAPPRWTMAFRARTLEGRGKATELIARTLARLERPPRVFVSASGIGAYGDRGEEWLEESAPRGSGFLADVCARWEDAARHAAPIRTVVARIGIVLAGQGGPLAEMVPPFRFGVGGRFGDGRQFMSWIGIDDLVGALHRAIFDDSLEGYVNCVAPTPLPNREFVRVLGRVLRRPSFWRIPGWALGAVLGREKARELVLSGQRVRPKALESAGFRFLHTDLEATLRHVFGR